MIQRWLHNLIFPGSWRRWWAGVLILPLIVLLIPSLAILLTPGAQTSASKPQALTPPAGEKTQASAPLRPHVVNVSLRRGDTLGSTLTHFGLEPKSVHDLIKAVRPFFDPKRMRAGESFRLFLDAQESTGPGLESRCEKDALVRVTSVSEGWLAERHEIPFVRETKVVRGRVDGSLYEDGTAAGLTPLQILDLGPTGGWADPCR
jgi:hypothetical protein